MQTGRSALIKKDGGEMLVAIALDRLLADAQALVGDPQKLVAEIFTNYTGQAIASSY
jgi:hypothetical protein